MTYLSSDDCIFALRLAAASCCLSLWLSSSMADNCVFVTRCKDFSWFKLDSRVAIYKITVHFSHSYNMYQGTSNLDLQLHELLRRCVDYNMIDRLRLIVNCVLIIIKPKKVFYYTSYGIYLRQKPYHFLLVLKF